MNTKITNQRFELIPLDKIESGKYQRPTNAAQVENIVKNFDEAKLGTLTLSLRNGRHFIIDGQHRLVALRQLEYTHCMCEILVGLTNEDEAWYFQNQGTDKRGLKPYDLYKAGLIAGDEKCLKIKEIVEANKFIIGFDNKSFHHIGAITALFTVVDDYGFEVLNETLRLIANTWVGTARATGGACILGVAEFVSRYDVADFTSRLHRRFSAVWNDYREIARRTMYSAKVRKDFCRVLVRHYNKSLGKNSPNKLRWTEE